LNVIFKAGGRLSEHTHDDSEEVIFCLEGEYIDLVNRVRLRSGEIQVIPKGQLHSGYSPLGCKLTILWKPPLKLMENKN
jgi:quercetin dioxygenase-like cupin family protein